MAFSILCQLSGGCMGCCGHDFESKEKIKLAIHLNSKELEEASPKSEKEWLAFRDRRSPYDLRYGVCRNLVEKKGCVHCPIHPSRQKGKELREGHCDINYLCPTAKKFEKWHASKQDEFVLFVEEKKLDNISYSMGMESGKLMKEFEK